MKVEKINKFFKNISKKIKPFILRALYALGALFEIGAVATSYGCIFPTYAEAASTDTPAATQTLIPKNTPEPTATPTLSPLPSPTPSSMPELTTEQKESLLGINDKFRSFSFLEFILYKYRINGNERIAMAARYNTENGIICCNILNDEYLFSIVFSSGSVDPFYEWKYVTDKSDMLKEIELTGSCGIDEVPFAYRKWGMEYKGNKIIDDLCAAIDNRNGDALMAKPRSKQEIIDLYLDIVPQEFIPPFWEYMPNTKMPDELKGIYGDIAYSTPIPSSTQQQSSRVDPNVKNGYKTLEYFKTPNHGRTI